MALGGAGGIEAASLYATVGVDIGSAVNNLARMGNEFDDANKSAERLERTTDDFGAEAREWANDFGLVAEEAAQASLKIDRLARRRDMPTAEAERLRASLDRIGREADEAGAEMAELARQGKSVDPSRSAALAAEINRVEKELKEATTQAARFDKELDEANNRGSMFGGTLAKIGGVMGALGFAGVTFGIVGMVRSMITGAAEMEKFRVQFEVLLGSAEAADARIRQLAEFGRTTPFELPEVVRASRTLEVFTKGALSAGEGLRLVGDVAAGVGMPFEEVAMWVGRMYDALQSGRPFGEATMRLQEMGAIGGEARSRIEELAEGVKSGSLTMTEAWAGVSGEFSRFSGMMERQSQTLGGQWSNLMDTINMGLTRMGEALMPLANKVIPAAIRGFGDLLNAGKPVMELVGERLVSAFEHAHLVVMTFVTVALFKLVKTLKETEGGLMAAAGGLKGFATVAAVFAIPVLGDLGDAFAAWLVEVQAGKDTLTDWQKIVMTVGQGAANKWFMNLKSMGVSVERWVAAVNDAGGNVDLALENVMNNLDPYAKTWERNMNEATRAAQNHAALVGNALRVEAIDQLQRDMQDIDDMFGSFVDSVEEVPEGIAARLKDGTVIVGENAEDLANKVTEAFEAAEAASVQAMKDMMASIVDIMSKEEVERLIEEQANSVANQWSDAGRRAVIEAELASQGVRDGLRSQDSAVVQDTINYIDTLLAQYEAMAPGALAKGELVNPALLEGVRSNLQLAQDEIADIAERLGLELDVADAAEGYGAGNIAGYVRGVESMETAANLAAQRARAQANQPLLLYDDRVHEGGKSLINSWLDGMESAWQQRYTILLGMSSYARNVLGGSLPTEGPLKGGVASGGESIIDSWFDGMGRAIGTGLSRLERGVALAADALGINPNAAMSPAYAAAGTSAAAMLGPAPPGGEGQNGGIIEMHSHLYLDSEEIAEDVTRKAYYGQPRGSVLPRN